MIQIRKHDKGDLYSIYGFFIDPNKDVWVDKKQLMELYNEIKKINEEEKNCLGKMSQSNLNKNSYE